MLLFLSKKIACGFVLPIFLTFLVACGSQPRAVPSHQKIPDRYIDRELEGFLLSYLQDAERAGVPVRRDMLGQLRRMEWQEEMAEVPQQGQETTLGTCVRKNEGSLMPGLSYRTIQVTRPAGGVHPQVNDSSNQALKIILYHELGHCLHDYRGHRPDSEQVIMSAHFPQMRIREETPQMIQEHFELMRR